MGVSMPGGGGGVSLRPFKRDFKILKNELPYGKDKLQCFFLQWDTNVFLI